MTTHQCLLCAMDVDMNPIEDMTNVEQSNTADLEYGLENSGASEIGKC